MARVSVAMTLAGQRVWCGARAYPATTSHLFPALDNKEIHLMYMRPVALYVRRLYVYV